MSRVLIVPDQRELSGPLVFLAGPIQGAPDWQSQAIRIIQSQAPGLAIASPRRSGRFEGDFKGVMYQEQVDWEHHRIAEAQRHGTILFWLAKEEKHYCDRAYAQTTRFELGEILALSRMFAPKSVVVGIEEGFSNARYIRYTIGKKYPEVPIFDSLQATCAYVADKFWHS